MEPASTPSVGDQVADFTLPASDGTSWTLSSQTARGTCLLVFYRGHW
jgi:peroxiredoxin